MTTVTAGELARLGLRREGPYFVDQAREVGLLVGEFGAFVGWLDVAWDGPATPAPRLCDVIHLPFPRQDLIDREVSAARARRVAALVTCMLCGQDFTVGYTQDRWPTCLPRMCRDQARRQPLTPAASSSGVRARSPVRSKRFAGSAAATGGEVAQAPDGDLGR